MCSGPCLQPPQAGSRCYCFQAVVPRESHRACVLTAFCDIFRVEKPKASLSNWSRKVSCTSMRLKGPGEGMGNSQGQPSLMWIPR